MELIKRKDINQLLAQRNKKEDIYRKILRLILTGPLVALYLEFYFFILLQGKIQGIENIPDGGCILAFNHESYLDWLLTYYIFRKKHDKKINFLAKAKLYKNPFWRVYLDYSDAIVIDGGSTGTIKNAFAAIRERIAAGEIVGIFPEGARTRNGKLQEGKPGIASLVISTHAPILPVALKGFYKAWPWHKVLPGIARCTIRVGKPIDFSGVRTGNKKDNIKNITERIMMKIKETIDEIER